MAHHLSLGGMHRVLRFRESRVGQGHAGRVSSAGVKTSFRGSFDFLPTGCAPKCCCKRTYAYSTE